MDEDRYGCWACRTCYHGMRRVYQRFRERQVVYVCMLVPAAIMDPEWPVVECSKWAPSGADPDVDPDKDAV